jgi:hypothetical protein
MNSQTRFNPIWVWLKQAWSRAFGLSATFGGWLSETYQWIINHLPV